MLSRIEAIVASAVAVKPEERFADNKAPTRLASGALDHKDLGWDAVLAPHRRHEYLTNQTIKLHLSVLVMDATAFRKATLGFVGFTQGVGVSTAPKRFHGRVRLRYRQAQRARHRRDARHVRMRP